AFLLSSACKQRWDGACIMHYGCQNNVITSTDIELMLNHCAALTAGRRSEGGFHF
uniref:Uncharacterized protein n=1 Tax=Seriola lalandi dorsalis TaxID=1841481 RepID=A0A3B4YKZ1_SERLL